MAEKAFFRGRPEMTRTEIFILRLFDKHDYSFIAGELNLSVKNTRDLYRDCKLRLEEAMQVLDNRRAVINDAEVVLKRAEKRSGKLSKSHRWFLLSKVFGLMPREIASMEDAPPATVSIMLKKVHI
jgi:DNA-directed RNA polymerase specialized sigma24 family protein